jgi:hypothetical protein
VETAAVVAWYVVDAVDDEAGIVVAAAAEVALVDCIAGLVAVELPAADELTVDGPLVDGRAVVDAIVEWPAVEAPLADVPAVEGPAVDETAEEDPAVVEPDAETLTVESPEVDERTADVAIVGEPAVDGPAVAGLVAVGPTEDDFVVGFPAVEGGTVETPALGVVMPLVDTVGVKILLVEALLVAAGVETPELVGNNDVAAVDDNVDAEVGGDVAVVDKFVVGKTEEAFQGMQLIAPATVTTHKMRCRQLMQIMNDCPKVKSHVTYTHVSYDESA